MRLWRNRHTRTFEGRVQQWVRVQVPSAAPLHPSDLGPKDVFLSLFGTVLYIICCENEGWHPLNLYFLHFTPDFDPTVDPFVYTFRGGGTLKTAAAAIQVAYEALSRTFAMKSSILSAELFFIWSLTWKLFCQGEITHFPQKH